jgi:hypothetical protein
MPISNSILLPVTINSPAAQNILLQVQQDAHSIEPVGDPCPAVTTPTTAAVTTPNAAAENNVTVGEQTLA